jgi:hypothetical protein
MDAAQLAHRNRPGRNPFWQPVRQGYESPRPFSTERVRLQSAKRPFPLQSGPAKTGRSRELRRARTIPFSSSGRRGHARPPADRAPMIARTPVLRGAARAARTSGRMPWRTQPVRSATKKRAWSQPSPQLIRPEIRGQRSIHGIGNGGPPNTV